MILCLTLPLITAGALLIVALLHLLWALRIWWPCKKETELARSVVGARNIVRMPSRSVCLIVALGLFVAAFVVFAPSVVPPSRTALALRISGAALSAVFLARGVFGYTRIWRDLTPEQPFRSLDARWYSPFCIALGTVIGWQALAS